MRKGLRWLGLGVSLGATFSIAGGRRLATPPGTAPLSLDPVPAVDPGPVPEPDDAGGLTADADDASADPDDTAGNVRDVDWGRRLDLHEVAVDHEGRRSAQDRRTGADRRVGCLEGLVGRIILAADRRGGTDRRSGAERRLSGGEALPPKLQRNLDTAA